MVNDKNSPLSQEGKDRKRVALIRILSFNGQVHLLCHPGHLQRRKKQAEGIEELLDHVSDVHVLALSAISAHFCFKARI